MFTSLFALVLATAAHASPAVGDQAAYQGTWDSKAVFQSLSFTGFNANTQEFKKVTVTKVGDSSPATQEDWVEMKDTASDAALNYIVNNCQSQGGVSETISVPAGTFPTCKMELKPGGFFWIGQVPFAVVRVETPVDGKMFSAVLTRFTRGTR